MFHLPCCEMTLTMQDVKTIFGLQLGGLSVMGIVDNDHWRELVAQFTAFLPPDDEVFKKNKGAIQAYLILALLFYSHRVSFSLVNFRKKFRCFVVVDHRAL